MGGERGSCVVLCCVFSEHGEGVEFELPVVECKS